MCFVVDYRQLITDRKKRSAVRLQGLELMFICLAMSFFFLLDSDGDKVTSDEIWTVTTWQSVELEVSSNYGWRCSKKAESTIPLPYNIIVHNCYQCFPNSEAMIIWVLNNWRFLSLARQYDARYWYRRCRPNHQTSVGLTACGEIWRSAAKTVY